MRPACTFKGDKETHHLIQGEMAIHFSLDDPFTRQYRVNDFWVMEQEVQLTITSRRHELPPGIIVHNESGDAHALWMQSMYAPEEVFPPNFWKVRAGDYLVVAGPCGDAMTLIPFEENAVVYWLKQDGSFPDLLEGMAGPDSPDSRHVEILRHASQEVTGRPMIRSFATEWNIDV